MRGCRKKTRQPLIVMLCFEREACSWMHPAKLLLALINSDKLS